MPSVRSRKKDKNVAFLPSSLDKHGIAVSMGVDPDEEPDVFNFLSRALDYPLPDPWTEHADKKGRIFYWNPASRASSWQHPLAPTHRALVAAYRRVIQAEDRADAIEFEVDAFRQQGEEEIAMWRMSHAPDNTPYYYKIGTEQTRWDNPRDELQHHMELRIQMLSDLAQQENVEAGETVGDATTMEGIDTTDPGVDVTMLPQADKRTSALPKPIEDDQGDIIVPGTHDRLSATPGGATAASMKAETPEATMLARTGKQGEFVEEANKRMEDAALKIGRTARAWLLDLTEKRFRAICKLQMMARRWIERRRRTTTPESEPVEVLRSTFSLHSTGNLGDGSVPGSPYGTMKGTSEELMAYAAGLRSPSHTRVPFSDVQVKQVPGCLAEALEGPESELCKVKDCVIPDEIALHLGMAFEDPTDMAAFAILKPVFLEPLPMPWQVLTAPGGRSYFYHPTLQEARWRHPMFGFFGELLQFLRVNAQTAVDITDPLSAEIFREASLETVRRRLGVWEGPVDPDENDGALYLRISLGRDEACAGPEGCGRPDDPRLEASSNILWRLQGWYHLWSGFAPDEVFPFLTDRLQGLATQLSESVLVMPGPLAETLRAQLAGRSWDWAKPKQMTKEEEALQPLVTSALGFCYGIALAAVGNRDRPEDHPKVVARVVLRDMFKLIAAKKEYSDDEEEYSEEEEFEDTFETQSEEESSELESTSEEESYQSSREGPASDEEDDLSTTAEDRRSPAGLHIDSDDEKGKDLTAEEEEEEEEIVGDADFLGFFLESPNSWAKRVLRPLTPTSEAKKEPDCPHSPGRPPTHNPRHADQLELWSEEKWLQDSIVHQWLNDLSWKMANQVHEAEWHEAATSPPGSPMMRSLAPSPKAGMSTVHESSPLHGALRIQIPQTPASTRNRQPPTPGTKVAMMTPNDFMIQRAEQHAEIENFARDLKMSADFFDSKVSAGQGVQEPADGSPWQLQSSKDGSDLPWDRRTQLNRPFMPVRGKRDNRNPDAEDTVVYRGCVACPPSPNQGAHPRPPHLVNALPPPKRSMATAAQITRPLSGGARGRAAIIMEPMPPIPPRRVDSADPKSRRRGGTLLLPDHKDSVTADVAVQSVKRFLSRTCGTMQAAFAALDTTGTGRITRSVWSDGLKRLGYPGSYDADAMFTALDHRKHHVLTVSDLIDQRGVSVFTGIPPLGINGVGCEIIHEAVHDAVKAVLSEALRDILEAELLAPRGPPKNVPDINAWIKKRKKEEKKRAQAEAEARKRENSKPTSPEGDRVHSPLGATSDVMDSQSLGPSSRLEDFSPSTSPSRGPSPPGSPNSPHGGRTKGNTGRTGKPRKPRKPGKSKDGKRTGRDGGSPSPQRPGKPGRREGKGGSPSPTKGKDQTSGPRQVKRMEGYLSHFAPAGGGKVATGKPSTKPKFGEADEADHATTDPGWQLRHPGARAGGGIGGRAKPYSHTKFSGYSWVNNVGDDLTEEEKMAWCPRPTQDIIKTYGHIFHILKDRDDPRLKKLMMPKQKRSIHVSVPRLPSGGSLEPAGDGDEQNSLSRNRGSMSTPDLAMRRSSSSRPGSGASSQRSHRNDHDRPQGVNLPPLTDSGRVRVPKGLVDPLGPPVSSIDARS